MEEFDVAVLLVIEVKRQVNFEVVGEIFDKLKKVLDVFASIITE